METPKNAGPESHDANGTVPPDPDAKASEPDEQESSIMHVFLIGIGSIALVAGATALIMSHQQTVNSAKNEQDAAAPSAAHSDPAAPPTVAELIKDGELNLQDRIELTDQDLLCVRNMRTIKSLNLTGCAGLTDASMNAIVSLPLTTLYVYGTKFSPAAYKKLSSLHSLQTLNAGGSDFDDSDVAAVSQIKTLTELRLPRCPRMTAAALKSIHSMTWLEKLALPGDNIRDSLSLLGSLHLTLLNLAADKVTNDDVNMLCQKIRTLSTLNIRDNPVGDAILADGSPLSTLPGLTNLSIIETPISHAAGEKFASKHKSCKVAMPEPGEPIKAGRADSQ
jgi:hypothetical protein